MKQIDIGWIPEDWEYEAVSNHIDHITGFPFKSSQFSNNGTKLLRGSNIKRNNIDWDDSITRFWSSLSPNSEKFLLKAGDIVIAMDGSLVGKSFGKIGAKDLPALLVQRVARIRGVSILTEYLSQWFCSDKFTKHCDQNKTSSAIPHISPKDITGFKIAFPKSAHEQQAIAEALNDAEAWIDSLEAMLHKKHLVKQGAMQDLLRPKEGWEEKKLGEVADIIGGGTPSTMRQEFWNGDINWFTPTEVGTTKYLHSSARKLTSLGLKSSSANLLPKGTILLTTRAGIGDLGILTESAATNQGFQSILTKAGYSNEFLYYLMFTMKDKLLKNASGSTFLEISPSKVKSLELNVPSEAEQARIAIILSNMDAEIETLEQKLTKARQIKQGMMQQLLTGQIRLLKLTRASAEKTIKRVNV